MTQEQQRLDNVNELMRVIASCGRQFFSDRGAGHPSFLDLDARGRVWFNDDYTGKRIYTHYPHHWNGFSHGGTLRELVITFRKHIKQGVQIRSQYFRPDGFISGRHPWGYPEADLETLHKEGVRLGIVKTEAACA